MIGPFIPIEEISKHFSVSVSTIRAWVRQGYIPKDTYIKVGNTYRFSITDVCNALANPFTTATSDTKEPDSDIPDIDIDIVSGPTSVDPPTLVSVDSIFKAEDRFWTDTIAAVNKSVEGPDNKKIDPTWTPSNGNDEDL